MVIRNLSIAECRKVLSSKSLARLACARDNQPYIVPILCYFDGTNDCLYSVAAAGQKIEWMRANPNVCVEVSDIVDRFTWTTVVATGRYEEISESDDDSEARRRAHELFEQRSQWWFPAMQKPEPGGEAHAVVYRVRIEQLTGRRAAPDA